MQTDSILIALTDTNFRQEVLESAQPVFVEFFAKWCGACHINAPIIHEMALEFQDKIKFCRIDRDTYKDIADVYSVQKIPTMLFFKDGHVVDYIVGITPRIVLTQKLKKLLGQGN